MDKVLEAPGKWEELYRARGDEVTDERPVFTGDVFALRSGTQNRPPGAPAAGPNGILVVQHPCALRTNGVDLVERILVAEVQPAALVPRSQWRGHFKVMPLPELVAQTEAAPGHHEGLFTSLLVVSPRDLDAYDRIATMSPIGVNLLLQRWVHHNSRVIVETSKYAAVTVGPYEEADLTEDWVAERLAAGCRIEDSQHECHRFLREPVSPGGPSRQDALGDNQLRSAVRRAAKDWLSKALEPGALGVRSEPVAESAAST